MSARPNIVLILADDMGYGDFGCFNENRSRTPALDQLVAEGTTLSQHYSASPVCAPARASLLTGRYPHRTGAIDTLETRGLDRISLRERTVADLLRAAGYATGLVGKWHNGSIDPRFHPTRRGFDEFVGFCGGWHPYLDWRIEAGGREVAFDGRYLTDLFTDEAIAFIRRHRRGPFFLDLSYNAPHFPFQALEPDVAPFRDTGSFTTAVSQIYGMIRCMDRGVAAVLDALDREGIAGDTLVLFSSDNGPQLGGRGERCTDRFNCGFAGGKTLVSEGGIRLPMLLRWPAGLDGARRIDDMVHFTDWMPTLLALAGVEAPRDRSLDGVDVLPLLRGERARLPEQRFWQWNRYAPRVECNAAMRDGRWKLVRPAIDALMAVSLDDFAMDVDAKYHPAQYPDILRDPPPRAAAAAAAPSQLFDLDADPEERHDRAAAHPERVLRMEAALGRWFEDVEADRRSSAPDTR